MLLPEAGDPALLPDFDSVALFRAVDILRRATDSRGSSKSGITSNALSCLNDFVTQRLVVSFALMVLFFISIECSKAPPWRTANIENRKTKAAFTFRFVDV